MGEAKQGSAVCGCGRAQRLLWLVVAFVLTLILQAQPALAQGPAPAPNLSRAAQKIKKKVSRIGIGRKLTVIEKDGARYHGTLLSIEPETFSLQEIDLDRQVTTAYSDVRKIQKGYGEEGSAGAISDPTVG
ncbi:MAG: hypothetical protein ACRD22_09670 [Terriglobia bacterium]